MSHQGRGSKPATAVNKLQQTTPFVCDIKFDVKLPSIPCDPKLLVKPVTDQQLASFWLTTLEKNPRKDLFLEPDNGVPIKLLDLDQYEIPEHPPPLAPEDEALLAEAPKKLAGKTMAAGAGAPHQELSWLMRTSYISSGSQQVRKLDAAKPVEEAVDESLDAQMDAIEATFAAYEQEPVHPTQPKMKAAKIWPVVPDFDNWGHNFVLVQFDSSLATELEAGRAANSSEVQTYLKSMGWAPPNAPPQKLVALLAAPARPKDEPEPEEQRLRYVRDYDFKVMHDQVEDGQEEMVQSAAFVFDDEQDTVKYLPLLRMNCAKRGKGMRSRGVEDHTRPGRITLGKRSATEAEIKQEEERASQLRGTGGGEE